MCRRRDLLKRGGVLSQCVPFVLEVMNTHVSTRFLAIEAPQVLSSPWRAEVVLASEPYAYLLFPALKHERCHECFNRRSDQKPLLRCTACKAARSSRISLSSLLAK